MPVNQRDIHDILYFRSDISPFLVHLTRDGGQPAQDARAALKKIVQERRLVSGKNAISDVRFGGNTMTMTDVRKRRYFGAICFTETPLSEVHCLLEINGRRIDLSPYGLVFVKEALQEKSVCPVCYINNGKGDMDDVFQSLFSLIRTHPYEAARLLPLFAVFGKKVRAPGAQRRSPGPNDFRWEREWRYPSVSGPLEFTDEDVFVGLCPDEEISDFEGLFPEVGFIDPHRNMKWYAKKLIEARQRLDLKYSVV